MPDKAEIATGLRASGHYGPIADATATLDALARLLNGWVAAWARHSVYMWCTEGEGGGGWLSWLRSIIIYDSPPVDFEGPLHEIAHAWEDAKVGEGVWTYKDFDDRFNWAVDFWPRSDDCIWAAEFRQGGYGLVGEAYASTASRVMGNLERLPLALRPYFEALFA